MKLLLTSAGIHNPSIERALVELLGKPIAECNALCVPTASYGHPNVSPHQAWKFISGEEPRCPMIELGWKTVGILELTALPSIDRARWVSWLEAADVLLVNGGDPMYLNYWMKQSGVADLLPSLDLVYAGLSAGSLIMTPRIGQDFVRWTPPGGGDDKTLGYVDFAIFPHVDHPEMPDNAMSEAEKWAAGMPVPCYAIDDDTAIRVVDGTADVISEGHWKFFPR